MKGVVIHTFFGDPLDDTTFQSTSVYIMCGPTTPIILEHLKSPIKWHFQEPSYKRVLHEVELMVYLPT